MGREDSFFFLSFFWKDKLSKSSIKTKTNDIIKNLV
uniref:Uncharacterized protein n=1 Tax=Heterorhabditis bacteriophora TaxID=37862 RepID=A0A1I7WKX1_HETBA